MKRSILIPAFLFLSISFLHSQPSGVFQMIGFSDHVRSLLQFKIKPSSDTLVVGIPPYDSLVITGEWTHQGPIIVIGNGILRFKNAHATIIGDIWVVGDHAVVTADSSYLYFPQAYFYQRALVAAGNAHIEYHNVTMDHSGLSHNVAVFDSASVKFSNVTDVGFTTWGTGRKAKIEIDHINTAGEFVITDSVSLRFSHVNTLLLWHQVPNGGSMNITFPSGDSLKTYTLNSSTPGVNGIGYNIDVDTSTNVMWALMPSTGSDITVYDSKLRSIGPWFRGHDTVAVSGLVDNSDYIDFTAPLTDRNLHLVNTSVQTWSLYPMDTTHLEVTGCILGEIGTGGRSSVTSTGVFVDGSGGYWWATDTTMMIVMNSTAVNDIRSDKSAIFIFGYSTLHSGIASAHGNSIMMLVQSQLPDEPQLWDGACIWNAIIGKPASGFVDTLVPVTGSAWIDKTPISQLMDFAWYQMSWQKQEDTAWHPLGGKIFTEKHDEVLVDWDTHGLTPGVYILRLVMCDNSSDSNKVEAVRGISLLPKILGIEEDGSKIFHSFVYPNPVTAVSEISFYLQESSEITFTIIDIMGRVILEERKYFSKGKNTIPVIGSKLNAGVYYYFLKGASESTSGNFVVSRP